MPRTRAREERERARNESKNDGFFSRLASAIGSFFDGIRNAIHAVFDAARKLVADAIAAAQRLAAAVIDRVRDAVVGLIQLAGKALIAIGDRVLAAFPKLREKFHNAINKLVDGAVAAVNKIADGMKKAVKTLLDLLGKALTAILDAYEALYMAAVNAVASAVKAAINAAKAIIQALGVFAQLIRDIASNPGAWLRNLGAALLDGVRNHLWKAFKAAVKEWFNSKVEAVVGIGKMIFEVLKKGGIPFSRIAKMVWVAVKSAIPRAIIEFLIQKVISLLVPAAAAIMAIIEGLRAAWATASRIIAAIGLFVDFLKQVKFGNAGPAFARAVAAAVIVVIEFTANFIISKIGKGAKGVGGKLSAIAAKIMAFLKKGVAAVGRVLKQGRQGHRPCGEGGGTRAARRRQVDRQFQVRAGVARRRPLARQHQARQGDHQGLSGDQEEDQRRQGEVQEVAGEAQLAGGQASAARQGGRRHPTQRHVLAVERRRPRTLLATTRILESPLLAVEDRHRRRRTGCDDQPARAYRAGARE